MPMNEYEEDNGMSLNAYQFAAGRFQLFSAPPEERVFGLMGECGEIAEVFKRKFRGDYETHGEFVNALLKESGDVLWYLSRLLADYDISLQEVAEVNISKLTDRQIRNTLVGKGSNR